MSNENNDIIVEEQTINWVDVAKTVATATVAIGIGYWFGSRPTSESVVDLD